MNSTNRNTDIESFLIIFHSIFNLCFDKKIPIDYPKKTKKGLFNNLILKSNFGRRNFLSFSFFNGTYYFDFFMLYLAFFKLSVNIKHEIEIKSSMSNSIISKSQIFSESFMQSNIFLKEIFFHGKKNKNPRKILKIKKFPLWFKYIFKRNHYLNPIQTKIFPAIINFDGNLILCAPTGSGKTLISIFAIVRIIINSIFFGKSKCKIIEKVVKIIYLAPMKTLVRQIFTSVKTMLYKFNFRIIEVTGDKKNDISQFKISNICIGTPEKLNIFLNNSSFFDSLCQTKLLIVDEIHLLNEKRGSVLENTLMNFLIGFNKFKNLTRILAISATFPNFNDLGEFLKVSPSNGIFYFSKKYRPFKLNQTIMGLKNFSKIKNNNNLSNLITLQKLVELLNSNPYLKIIVFVQSRRDTYKTSYFFLEKKINFKFYLSNKFNYFKKKIENLYKFIKSPEIKRLLSFGISIHHAGLPKKERLIIETLFRKGLINILVSTTTLAWGINLPTNIVIIKGTTLYSPEKFSWIERSPLDIIQMMGRAGRGRNFENSEGFLITSIKNISFYTNLFNQQTPVESRLMSVIPDFINNEVSKKRIVNLKNALNWFLKSFFWIRLKRGILKNFPDLLGHKGPNLKSNLKNLFTGQSLNELISCGLIVCSHEKALHCTPLGIISSEFIISHDTMLIFLSNIKPLFSSDDLLLLFSMCMEVKSLQIKDIENMELEKLENLTFFPVKAKSDTLRYKINVLLQAYIGNLKIQNLSLVADSVFVGKIGSRLFRAFFEISIYKRWASLTHLTLQIYFAIKNRSWPGKSLVNGSMKLTLTSKFLKIINEINSKKNSKNYIEKMAGKIFFNFKTLYVIQNFLLETNLAKVTFSVHPITKNAVRIHFFLELFKIKKNYINKQKNGCWVFLEDNLSDTLIFYNFFQINRIDDNNMIKFSAVIPFFEDPITPSYTLKLKFSGYSNSEIELIMNFTEILMPNNFYFLSENLIYRDLWPSRYLSGLYHGILSIEYFKTNLRKLKNNFFQILPSFLKSLNNKIFISEKKTARDLFCEISILSILINEKKSTSFYLSMGTNSISLIINNLRTMILGIICIPVKRIIGIKLHKPQNKNKTQSLNVLSFTEAIRLQNIYFFSSFLRRIFFIDSFHFVGESTFGSSLELFFQKFFQETKLVGTCFPISNLVDFLEWMNFDKLQLYLDSKIYLNKQKFFKKIHFQKRFYILEKSKKTKLKNVGKTPILFYQFSLNSSKKKIYSLVRKILKNLNKKVFLNSNYLSIFFIKNFEKNKVSKILYFLKIFFIEQSLSICKKRILEELFCRNYFISCFLKPSYMSKISVVKLNSKTAIFEDQIEVSNSSFKIFPEISAFSDRSPFLKKADKNWSIIYQITPKNFFIIESYWRFALHEYFVKNVMFFNNFSVLYLKNLYLKSFLLKRIRENPHFYVYIAKNLFQFDMKMWIVLNLKFLEKEKIIKRAPKFYLIITKNRSSFENFSIARTTFLKKIMPKKKFK